MLSPLALGGMLSAAAAFTSEIFGNLVAAAESMAYRVR
jgi:hypothetical protein